MFLWYRSLSYPNNSGKSVVYTIPNSSLHLKQISPIFPQSWKTAVVIRISKPTIYHLSVSLHRPISLKSWVNKIFEKIIAGLLMWFLQSHNFLTPNQTALLKDN